MLARVKLFGTSGIRAITDKSLLQLGMEIGLSMGPLYNNIILGSDTRTSSPALKHALISGLLASGAKLTDAGVLPTPTLAWATKGFDAGVMITASHNPPEYNGLKFLNPDGSSFDTSQRGQLEKLVLDGTSSAAPWNKMKNSSLYSDAVQEHINRILKDFPVKLKLKVVLDCVCGAASLTTPYLLRELGCEVIALNSNPSSFSPHDAEPTEANLGDLIRATKEYNADLGIAHDGDADRMMAVDDKGRYVSGDRLLAILALNLDAKEIVTTVDASMALDEMGFKVRRTRVGDSYVSAELKNGGDFGGEPSGSWVFPSLSLCPDGVYAAAQMATIASKDRLSGLVDKMPSYPILRGSVTGKEFKLSQLEERLMRIKPLTVSNTDGIRLGFEDGWLLVRPSGTEPKIRVTAEAKNSKYAHKLYDEVIRIIKDSGEN